MEKAIRGKSLTSGEAARLLGVSEASVKRWADAGRLPAVKTAGGHRRFRPEDVAAFRRRSLAGRAPGAADGDFAEAVKGAAPQFTAALDEALSASLLEKLVAGREAEASAALVTLHLHGHTVARIADALLCPALREVGELWRAGELTVAQEHVATRTSLTAIQALRASLGAREHDLGRVGLCCSVEEDFHELPIQLASLTLEARGWTVLNLGVSTPFFALAEAVGRFRPRVVCVASTVFRHPDRAAREYAEFAAAAVRAGSSVVLGGAGFGGDGLQRRFPAELYAETFTQLDAHAAAVEAEADAELKD